MQTVSKQLKKDSLERVIRGQHCCPEQFSLLHKWNDDWTV